MPKDLHIDLDAGEGKAKTNKGNSVRESCIYGTRLGGK